MNDLPLPPPEGDKSEEGKVTSPFFKGGLRGILKQAMGDRKRIATSDE